MRHVLCVLLVFLACCFCALPLWADGVCDMRVEYAVEPLGIDVAAPRFSWQMATDTTRHGQRQQAWQIVVTDPSGETVWNSGRCRGASSLNVGYAGRPLRPSTSYRWRLTVWNERNRPSTGESWFETGLMSSSGWGSARWIGSASASLPVYAHYLPVFRIGFTVCLDAGAACPKAAFVYGANDARLMSADKNILGVAAPKDSSFVKIELDGSADTLRLNVFRVGYTKGDSPLRPLCSVALPQVPRADIARPHTVELSSVLGMTQIFFDGSERPVATVNLNPMGKGGDYIAFPVLGDYGFVVPEGQRARFGGVKVSNYRSPQNTVITLAADTLITRSTLSTAVVPVRPEPMLRTVFTVAKPVGSARLYVTARGTYRFFVNGGRVGDDYLNPGLTQYNKTHYYQTYDVTSQLRPGRNAMGAMLAEGWWRGGMTYVGENWNFFGDRSSLLAKLVITYTDGTTDTVVTDPFTWRCLDDGPLLCGSLFQGEVYDAQRAAGLEGWSTPAYDASAWAAAGEVMLDSCVSREGSDDQPRVDDYSEFCLTAQPCPTVRAVDTLTARSVSEVRPGVFVYDMGQNMAGVPEIHFAGLRAGTEVTLRFAEVTYPDLPRYGSNKGMVMLENIRAAMAQDMYIAAGGAAEVFCPAFTYHGYRYVEITGLDRPLPLDAVRGIVLSSVHSFSSDYVTSDSLVNRLWQNIGWSMRANFFSVPTDCPQRNERMGWAGDISVFSPTATYMGCVPQFLAGYARAMRDVQRADGKFLDIAPVGGGFGGILWGSAGITVPWHSYLQFADSTLLADNYAAMRRYVGFLLENTLDSVTGIIVQQRTWGDLADWLGPEDDSNDRSLLWECYLIYDLDIMTRVATLLGHADDAARFARLAARRRELFNRTYIQKGTAKTMWSDFDVRRKGDVVDTQTSYVLPLAFGIVADSVRTRFFDNLVSAVVRSRGDYGSCSLLTGFIGTAWISKVLSDNGRPDLAYSMLLNTDYPSWLYSVTQGATTIWERLNSYTHKDGFGRNNRMNSFNHYSFGAVGEWMISRSLGIRTDESAPGFARFMLEPEPDPTGRVTFARGHYDSMYGRIVSGWSLNGGTTVYSFSVPANTTATLRLRASHLEGVGKGARIVSRKDGVVVIELQSGNYKFTTR